MDTARNHAHARLHHGTNLESLTTGPMLGMLLVLAKSSPSSSLLAFTPLRTLGFDNLSSKSLWRRNYMPPSSQKHPRKSISIMMPPLKTTTALPPSYHHLKKTDAVSNMVINRDVLFSFRSARWSSSYFLFSC